MYWVHRHIINLIGSVTLSVEYSHSLTTGMGFKIGDYRQVSMEANVTVDGEQLAENEVMNGL